MDTQCTILHRDRRSPIDSDAVNAMLGLVREPAVGSQSAIIGSYAIVVTVS